MQQWVELENTYLTDRPLTWDRATRSRVPDPSVEPTEAWLFTFDCQRTKRGVRRNRSMVTLKGRNEAELDEQLFSFMERPDVVLIEDTDRHRDYLRYRGEPAVMALEASA